MKLKIDDIGGVVAKQDERYIVKDNTFLKNLIVSSTSLNSGKSTSGHKHPGQEEVYYFVNGSGEMELDSEKFVVSQGDVILIPDGAFHRVHNTGTESLYFVCVFDGKRNH